MASLRTSLSIGLLFALGACVPPAIIESASDGDSVGSETDGSSGTGGGAEAGSASASTGDGDGDPATGDGDGDPTTGDPTTSGDGDGDPDPCGNGIIEQPEECDTDNFGGDTCENFGLISGSLICTEDCTIDTSNCEQIPCGNGVIDPGEECDGDNFDGQQCADFGEGPGQLSCSESCVLGTGDCGLDGEGDFCDPFDFVDCDDGLYCVAFECWDGSVGDTCTEDNQCVTGDCDKGNLDVYGECAF